MVRYSRVESMVLGSSPTELFIPSFFFFSVFCVVVFYKYFSKEEACLALLVIHTNGTENFGRFGKSGKKVIP